MPIRDQPGRYVLVVLALATLAALAGCSSQAAPTGEIQFENATAASGLDYTDEVTAAIGGGNSGVYVLDYDGDGWQDLLTTGGTRPVLWHNDGGHFERADALPVENRSFKSAAVLDFDGDADQDLVLFPPHDDPVALANAGSGAGEGPTGEGAFRRTDVGLPNLTYPLGGAAADYDGDGDQDLLVYQSGDWANGKPTGYTTPYDNIEDDNGNPNLLFENRGGTFERVPDSGLSGERWSLAASFVDLTDDGRPDIHVANDYNSDVLYVNEGNGTFDRRLLGNETARNGMSSEVGDVDGDGRLDVFVTNIEIPINRSQMSRERYERIETLFGFVVHSGRTNGNNLLVNQGDGRFADRAEQFGVRVGGWGWAASYADLDNDGRRDMIHATQNVVVTDPDDPTYTYPMVFQRQGESFTRLDSGEAGLETDDGRGLVTLDYDHDGRLEVVSANYGERFTVYDENTSSQFRSLQFVVTDGNGETALGATAVVQAGGRETTVRQQSRTDFLSSEGRFAHVGTRSAETATLTVTWPDGTEQTFENVETGQIVRLTPSGVETIDEVDA